MKFLIGKLKISDIGYARSYGAVVLAILIVFWYISFPLSSATDLSKPNSTPSLSPAPTPVNSPSPQVISIYVVGEVVNPGVYHVPIGSLVEYAILQAGGFSENADLLSINLAYILRENCMIVVGNQGYTGQSIISSSILYPFDASANHRASLVNLNTATIEELCTLPGIGESIAQRIINYREQNRFNAIEEIMNVSGIGQAKFEGIRDLITVE